jgi:hypothetical protein
METDNYPLIDEIVEIRNQTMAVDWSTLNQGLRINPRYPELSSDNYVG